MKINEIIVESSRTAGAEQVWDYVRKIHPDDQQGGGFLKRLIMRHPQYELKRIPLSSLHIPDQELDDEEQQEPYDPYGRAMFVDPDHAGEYSMHHIDTRPIVIDTRGNILDGSHRAWAAAELMNKKDIMAYVPVLQLDELGNAPTEYKANRKRKNSLFHATVEGHWVDVFFDRSEFNGTLHITFTVNGNYDAPEQPTSASKSTVKILSTVLNVVKQKLPEYIKKSRPPAISFTSKQDNRTSLYRKYFVPVIQNILGAKWQHEEYPSMGMTVFHWRPVKKQGVTEAFDQPYDIRWSKGDHGDYDAYAELDDGTGLEIAFLDQQHNSWMVDFFRDNSTEITGDGDAYRVFATVLTAIREFIVKQKPDKLNFSAEKQDDPRGSRASLYDRMIQRYISGTGYALTRQDYPDGATYTLTRTQQDVAEDAQLPGDFKLMGQNLFLKNLARNLKQRYPDATVKLSSDRVTAYHNEGDDEALTVMGTEVMDSGYIGVGLDDAFTESFQGVLVPTIKQTTEQLLAANPGTKPALFLSTDNWNPDAWTHIATKLGYRLVADDESLDEQDVAEGKIKLSTDPNWYGATVDNYQASGPVVNIPANQLVGFEPEDKMNQPKSKVNVEKIVAGLKQGAKLPPLLVRKYKNGYQVLDGHHRFWAYKLLGVKSIPSQIVPDSDIEEISKQGVAEGQLDELFQHGKQNWTWKYKADTEAIAKFTVGDRDYVWQAFNHFRDDKPHKWEIQFRVVRQSTDPEKLQVYGTTGTGNSAEVMSIAVDIMREFLQYYGDSVQQIAFDAKENSRIALYRKMVQRLLPNWNADEDYNPEYGLRFTLTKPKSMAEGKQPGQPVVDAILKVMPTAQEIWFHGSRATGKHRKNSDTDILVVVPDDLVGDQYLGVVRILQKLSSHFDNYDIQPTKSGANIYRMAQEEGRLLWPNKQGVAENIPQPGESSGAPKQFGPDAKIQTRQMTVKQIISSVPGLPYYNNVVDDWDAKDYSWGVTKKVIEYATYLKQHPESLSQLPPILVLNGKFEDGAHRVSAIWLLQQRMDPKNPLWANAKLNVQFVKQGVTEGESNDTAISLSKLGKFHPGADTLAEFVPERTTAQYALHPDKWESTFYSLTNKDSDKLKYYGPKKISIPPGTLVGDMAIANKFYRAKTSEEKQQYAELYKASLQPYPVDVSEYRMPELLIPKQGVAENFADGKNPGRKGLAKRSGVNTKASVSSLRKTAKNSSGEKQRMAHWLANMKAGKANKNG